MRTITREDNTRLATGSLHTVADLLRQSLAEAEEAISYCASPPDGTEGDIVLETVSSTIRDLGWLSDRIDTLIINLMGVESELKTTNV